MIMSMKYRLVRLSLASASLGALAVAAAPVMAQAQERTFNIPAQPLSSALLQFSNQSDVLVVIAPEIARGKKSQAVTGSMSPRAAIDRLLRGTGLRAVRNASGGYRVERSGGGSSGGVIDAAPYPSSGESDGPAAGVPEILVVAPNGWTLNTGIARTEDDTQPYTVFTKEQIQRSGSNNLEDFFRDNLGSNTSVSTSNQSNSTLGRTNINLRGLGAEETLILLDGRRIPGINRGTGELEQGAINGIPLGSIERIEVLASSASGIYGSSATGGVINIILRRDYRGVQLSGAYRDTFEGGGADRQIDATGGLALEGGRTNISFSGSARKTSPLYAGDRDLIQRGREFAYENNPALFLGRTQGPLGYTPNIRSATGVNLTLDPAYGGASLGSPITFSPVGFRGVALDGVAGLVANAGSYNLDLADTAGSNFGDGGRVPLLSGSENYSGTIAVRREFNNWLKAYVEASASTSRNHSIYNPVPTTVQLAANAPNNPFQQAVVVTVPHVGADKELMTRNKTLRLLTGAIVKLPFDWQAVVDLTWNYNKFRQSNQGPIDAATTASFASGAQDVLRDTNAAPLTYGFLESDFGERFAPAASRTQTQSLRLAGPLPFALPGGKPAVTLLLERNRDTSGAAIRASNTTTYSLIEFTPERSRVGKSVYGEIRLPIIGNSNDIPLIEEFEFQAAGRYDHYIGTGADIGIDCIVVSRPLTAADLAVPCPPAGANFTVVQSRRSVFDPTLSLRWKVTQDIMFRGSYARGFLPPFLSQLVKLPVPLVQVQVTDPERGNEAIGTPLFPGFVVLSGPGNFAGGNPDVKPESSESWTAGVILTPRFLPGLRFAVDWTKITKKNNYFNPQSLLTTSLIANPQPLFEDFLRANPERFTRGPASGGFAVGPITGIDASLANLAGSRVEAIDFSLDYRTSIGNGTLHLAADTTYLRDLSIKNTESAPYVQFAGLLNNAFSLGLGGTGGLRWKGNASAVYTNDKWSVGWRGRFYDSYIFGTAAPATQGTNRIPSQMYHDLFGSYRLFKATQIRAGVNNIFNKKPPIDTGFNNYYSRLGDPRLANFYLSIVQDF